MLRFFKGKPLTGRELANQAERILSGDYRTWDVDTYESRNPKDPKRKDLHIKTFGFGLPETWAKLDKAEKNKLPRIIEEMRQLSSNKS